MLKYSAGLPATALRPRLRPRTFPYHHCWTPPSSSTTRGAYSLYLAGTWRSNMSAGSQMWSSTLMRMRSSARIGQLLGLPAAEAPRRANGGAGVNRQGRAGDIAGGVGHEVEDGVGHVLGLDEGDV